MWVHESLHVFLKIKGVVECICILLYSNLKPGYLTNINKSKYNLEVVVFFFFLAIHTTLLYCTSGFCLDTNGIKSYCLKPGLLHLVIFHGGLIRFVYSLPLNTQQCGGLSSMVLAL